MNNNLDSKALGLIETPPKTVEYIISRLGGIEQDKKILDPCVGPGIFVKKLLEKGVNKNQIYTLDIHKDFKDQIEKMGVSFEQRDYLLSNDQEPNNKYDFIIGNPPYLNKSSSYIHNNKVKLQKIYGKINAHETYAMFIVNSIWRLKEEGKLAFITSDSFLTLITHTRLREFILNNCKINEILLAPKNLFDKQNVSTTTAIIILTKYSGKDNKEDRQNNIMRIIPRIENEQNYQKPRIIYNLKQKNYHLLPFNIFFIDIEEEIIDLFEKAPKLENHIQGYIGMHTHNNLKFIAAVDDSDLAEIFKKKNEKIYNPEKKFRVISKEKLESGEWKPYLKRGGKDQYYRPIIEALDWSEQSRVNYDIPNTVPFESEGIVISGISSRLAARYMPRGCYWDSNKAIGFIIRDNTISIEYALGLLNSSLYNYLAKGIINNTNSIQLTGVHALPLILPDHNIKEKVEQLVRKIIEELKSNQNYDYNKEQKKIDTIIFNYYSKQFNFPNILKGKLDEKFSIYAT